MPKSARCLGVNADGSHCRKKTLADSKCWIHSRKEDKLAVKKSTVPKGGKGLFAEKWREKGDGVVFKKGEEVTKYSGKILNKKKLDKKFPGDTIAEYVIQVTKDHYIDAQKPTSCLGRFMNAATNRRRPNAKFARGTSRSKAIKIMATKNIKNGEELFASYGEGEGLGYENRSA